MSFEISLPEENNKRELVICTPKTELLNSRYFSTNVWKNWRENRTQARLNVKRKREKATSSEAGAAPIHALTAITA